MNWGTTTIVNKASTSNVKEPYFKFSPVEMSIMDSLCVSISDDESVFNSSIVNKLQ